MNRRGLLAGGPVRDAWVLGTLCLGHLLITILRCPDWLFAKYPDGARLLSRRQLGPEEVADFSPLYLLVNAAVSPAALRWFQAVASCVAVIATYRLALRLSGRTAGLCAATLSALCLPLFIAEVTLEPDHLIAVLTVLALALWVDGVSARTAPGAALTGMLLGAAASLRPTGLLFLFLAYAAHAFAGRGALRKQGLAAVLLALGLCVALLPTLWLRRTVGAEAGATMSVGAVLHHGNRPEGTGLGAQPPHLLKMLEVQIRSSDQPDPVHSLYRRFAQASSGEALHSTAAELFWVKQVVAFVTLEPVAYLQLLLRKLLALGFGPEAYDIGGTREVDRRLHPLPSALPLAALGLVGLAFTVKSRRLPTPLLLYLVYCVAIALAFYVSSRYRVGLVLVWTVFGGVALAAALAALRSRQRGPILGVALGSGAVALVLLLSSHSMATRMMTRAEEARRHQQASATLRAARQWSEAEEAFYAARAAQPFIVELWDLRGYPFEREDGLAESAHLALQHEHLKQDADSFLALSSVARTGHCDEALPHLQALAERGVRWAINDWSLDPALEGAACLLRKGRKSEALAEVRRSLDERPGTLDGLAQALAAAQALPAETAGDQPRWEARLRALHDPLSAGYALARAHLSWGSPHLAVREADSVLARLPEAALVHHVRAEALADLGRNTDALSSYDRAITLFPAHRFTTHRFDAALTEALALRPRDPALLALAADHALRQGRRQEARRLANLARSAAGPELDKALLSRLSTIVVRSR